MGFTGKKYLTSPKFQEWSCILLLFGAFQLETSEISVITLEIVTMSLKAAVDRVNTSEISLLAVPVNHSISSNKRHMTSKGHWWNFGIGTPANQIYFLGTVYGGRNGKTLNLFGTFGTKSATGLYHLWNFDIFHLFILKNSVFAAFGMEMSEILEISHKIIFPLYKIWYLALLCILMLHPHTVTYTVSGMFLHVHTPMCIVFLSFWHCKLSTRN